MGRVRSGRATVFAVGVAALLAIASSATPGLAQDPSASPGPDPTAELISLGATTELLIDDLESPTAWGLIDEDGVRIAGEDGGLRIRLQGTDQAHWTWRDVDRTSAILRVAVSATIGEGRGSGGPMCGSTGEDPSFYLATVTTDREWVLARIVGGSVAVIARGGLSQPATDEDTPVRLELECAVTGDGRDRLGFFVDGVNVADATDASSLGPFSEAGLYGEVFEERFEVLFDDLLVLGGDVYDPVVEFGPRPDPSPDRSREPGGLRSLGATTLIHQEPFDDETRWGVLKGEQGSIAYDNGTLRVVLRPADNSLWSWLPFQDVAAVLGVEVSVALDAGQGSAGPMCGSAGEDPSFYHASLARSGRLILGSVTGRTLTEIDRFAVPAGAAAVRDGPVRVRIECGVVGDGTDRVAAWVDGALVADVTTASTIGPFAKAAILATNGQRRWGASFDDLVVSSGAVLAPSDGSPVPTPTPTPAPVSSAVPATPLPVGALLDAVPDAFQADCRGVPEDGDTGQLEAVLCVPAGTAATAEYYRYDTPEALRAAFDRYLTRAGGDRGNTDCTAGPAVTDYTISGRTAGELACYDHPRGGVAFQWSNRDLLVLSFGTHRSGAYADAYAWWQDAGPVP